jgi:hypothetical protein
MRWGSQRSHFAALKTSVFIDGSIVCNEIPVEPLEHGRPIHLTADAIGVDG